MRLVIDVNLPPGLAGRLRETGHDAQHWSEVGAINATDAEILAWAANQSAVVLTSDLDFGAILAATSLASPSVVQIRTQDILSERLEEQVFKVLVTLETELLEGAIVSVDLDSARVRILPLR